MALIRARKQISLNEVKTGHVLEIKYDKDTDLILVIDPKATTVANTNAKDGGVGQGRAGKLHAIKLKNLVETDLVSLIKMIRDMKNVDGRAMYDKFKSSPYADGKRNYRTYSREKIGSIIRVSVGQASGGTNKLEIGGSILYGVEHGSHVQLALEDYDTFRDELLRSINNTFYEGPSGHEKVTKELMEITIGTAVNGNSWEPSPEEFNKIAHELNDVEGLGTVGGNVAGWWNQWIRGDTDGGKVATKNIKGAWEKTGFTFDATIREAFEKSVGSIRLIESKWQTYTYGGKTYDWQYVAGLMDSKGWDSKGNPTQQLIEFNEAGHFQVFPNDSAWNMEKQKYQGNYVEGELFKAQDMFNEIRDTHLVRHMKTKRGIYFAGAGHLDNIRAEKYKS